ncbi:hypothetical protein GIB67_025408 [Kingdonia uniflora]|uniref:C3H1-type domain-containing protein n=1 Tax=Kingdonia uniflora TaxID=39325 RepID=A0A7J7NC83_9MAGN|nr:hypothetical protein GIB67_025408 [Kingdonia uniflora]
MTNGTNFNGESNLSQQFYPPQQQHQYQQQRYQEPLQQYVVNTDPIGFWSPSPVLMANSIRSSPPTIATVTPNADYLPHKNLRNFEETPVLMNEMNPYKKPRNFEETPSPAHVNEMNPFPNARIPPPPTPTPTPTPTGLPINRGNGRLFFKTRVCTKYLAGICPYGSNCNFAHGQGDVRQPTPNWQEIVGSNGGGGGVERAQFGTGNWDEDQRIITKNKLCKRFCNGEPCPYGLACNFLHEDPAKFRDTVVSTGMGSIIACDKNRSGSGSGSDQSPPNFASRGPPPVNPNNDLSQFRVNVVRPSYWKTRMCNKWEATGQCRFGDECHYAHGLAGHVEGLTIHRKLSSKKKKNIMSGDNNDRVTKLENQVSSLAATDEKLVLELQMFTDYTDAQIINVGTVPLNPPPSSDNDVLPSAIDAGDVSKQQVMTKKQLLMSKGPKKLSRIYADWIDDIPNGCHLLWEHPMGNGRSYAHKNQSNSNSCHPVIAALGLDCLEIVVHYLITLIDQATFPEYNFVLTHNVFEGNFMSGRLRSIHSEYKARAREGFYLSNAVALAVVGGVVLVTTHDIYMFFKLTREIYEKVSVKSIHSLKVCLFGCFFDLVTFFEAYACSIGSIIAFTDTSSRITRRIADHHFNYCSFTVPFILWIHEMQKFTVCTDAQIINVGTAPLNPPPSSGNDALPNAIDAGDVSKQQVMTKKLSRIYADWIDDILM